MHSILEQIDNTSRAAAFAAGAHFATGQRRKINGEPYIVHPADVVSILTDYFALEGGVPFDCSKPSKKYLDEIYAAAWLHDVVEDTEVSIGVIHEFFGPTIRLYVQGMTKIEQDKTITTRAQRVKIEIERLKGCSSEVKLIKMADIFSNTRDILDMPDRKYALQYASEKLATLSVLECGECQLFTDCLKQVNDAIHTLIIEAARG